MEIINIPPHFLSQAFFDREFLRLSCSRKEGSGGIKEGIFDTLNTAIKNCKA